MDNIPLSNSLYPITYKINIIVTVTYKIKPLVWLLTNYIKIVKMGIFYTYIYIE